jgi:hypothetical protein
MTTVEGALLAGACAGAKPLEILRESMADLVDANPYADTVNAVENSARALAERFQPEGSSGFACARRDAGSS